MPSALPARDGGDRNTAMLKSVDSGLSIARMDSGGSGGGGLALSRGGSAASLLLRGASSSSLRRSESGLSILLGELQQQKKEKEEKQQQQQQQQQQATASGNGATAAGSGGGSAGGSVAGGADGGSAASDGTNSVDVQKEERVVMTNYGADDVPLHRRAILQKIPREWVKCIASYTALEKRLSWLMLVHALWSDEKQFKLKINIPDTVLFHNGRILCWLFTSPRTGE